MSAMSQQEICILRALVKEPQLLIFDQTLAALESDDQDKIREKIVQIIGGDLRKRRQSDIDMDKQNIDIIGGKQLPNSDEDAAIRGDEDYDIA